VTGLVEQLRNWIEGFDNIVIIRHKSPDLDAYGAQFGLYHALKAEYPSKRIIAAGDVSALPYFGELVPIEPSLFQNAMVFVLDTVAKQMLENTWFETAKLVVLVDHHQNDPDVLYHHYLKNTGASSTSEMICDLLEESRIAIPLESAKALFLGIVGDTGRFQYSNTTAHTFATVGKLLQTGLEIQPLYQLIYAEPLKMRKLKNAFSASIEFTKNNVAYRRNDKAFLEQHQVDTPTVSRGMVNQMAGISEVPIWANFTYDFATQKIACELRSRSLTIVHIAKKYGGGGHNNACGCTVATWDDTNQILDDLDRLLEENHG
jgi:bifunctional oligoribonuclease and PAP phosphatase NrnA